MKTTMTRKTNSPWSSEYVKMGEVLTLRTSLIKTYLRCPAQCLFRYFKGLVVLPRSFITMGSCTHIAAEHGNKYKRDKGREAKVSVLQDVFHESFKKKSKTTWWQKGENPNDFEREGTKGLIPCFHEKIYKKVDPKYVEEPFKIVVPEEKLEITGTLDLITQDHTIRDLKTKKRTPNWMEAMKSYQGKSYMAGYKSKFNKTPKGFILDCLIRKTKPEAMSTKLVKSTETNRQEFLDIAIRVARGIRAGNFYPNRDGNYFCSPNSCGFWDICTKGAWRDVGVFTKVFGSNQAEDDTKGEED